MKQLYSWFCCNNLSLHLDKTKYIIFRTRGRRVQPDLDDILIGGHIISRVNNIPFLGITVDELLSWKPNITNVCSKVSRGIGIISRLRFILPRNILLTLYHSIILAHLTYCNIVWGNTYKNYLNKLIILQKRSIRLASLSPYNCPSKPLFHELRILPIPDLISLNSLIFMFKYQSGDLPKLFDNMFTLNSSVHSYNTRQCNMYHKPQGPVF